LERLRFIAAARRLGFALADVRALLAARESGAQPCARVLQALDTQLATINQRIAELLRLRADLQHLRGIGAPLQHPEPNRVGLRVWLEPAGAIGLEAVRDRPAAPRALLGAIAVVRIGTLADLIHVVEGVAIAHDRRADDVPHVLRLGCLVCGGKALLNTR
jgi:hypothetical protein